MTRQADIYEADRSQAAERHRVLADAHTIIKTSQVFIKDQAVVINNISHKQDVIVASSQQQELLLRKPQDSVTSQNEVLTGSVKLFSK